MTGVNPQPNQPQPENPADRSDEFLKMTAHLSDNRDFVGTPSHSHLTVDGSFARQGAQADVTRYLMKCDIRADFAEYLEKQYLPHESLTTLDLPDHLDLFIEAARSKMSNPITYELYQRVSADELKAIVLFTGDQYISAFSGISEDESVLNIPMPTPLERFDRPIATVEDAYERFIDFQSSPFGEQASTFCSGERENLIAFRAFRIARGIADNAEAMDELFAMAG